MASALSSCHLEATLTNLHQTFRSKHSSLEYCSILFLCPHLAETFLTLRVTYLCLFPRSLFLLIVLATQLVPYCQAVVPPLAKGLHFKDRLCPSYFVPETLFPATAVIQAVSGYVQGRLKGCGFSRKILANFCARKHSAAVLNLTKARRSEERGKQCDLWPR